MNRDELSSPNGEAKAIEAKLTPTQARALLWEQADLSWKLEPPQREIYNFIKECPSKTVVIAASRRLGKSHALCALAVEMCIAKPKSTVKYLAGQQRMVQEITSEIMPTILNDCPAHLKPIYKSNRSCWLFPNGSKIQMAGVDNKRHDRLRGGSSVLCIVDEAGFVSELKYTVRSVLIPTTTTTGGKTVLISTPPESPDHEFCGYMEKAAFEGSFLKKTIYDYFVDYQKAGKKPTRITEDEIELIAEEYGGRNSTEFRREFVCEVVTEETSAIIPEFTEAVEQDTVKNWDRPPYYHAYTAMDIGMKDLTAVLFAYYDFKNDKVVIEDELIMQGYEMTTDKLAELIKYKESELWKDPVTKVPNATYKRICDNNLIVINDLQRLHSLMFLPTQKDDSLAAINNVRMMVAQRRLIIHPRCETLIRHLKNGKWNKTRTSFARSPENGHYDTIDSLKYLLRNIDYGRNPYPSHYDITRNMSDPFVSPHYKTKQTSMEDWAQLVFGKKKRS